MSAQAVIDGRRARARRRALVTLTLGVAIFVVFWLSLMIGSTIYSPLDIVRVMLGEQVQGASFSIGVLRLPRATMGLLTGLCFGIAGVTFQTMLRNPLASPDIIGINAGASAAAVFAIVVLSLSDTAVSLFALAGAVATALAIYLLSN